jgi:hypothetical protein
MMGSAANGASSLGIMAVSLKEVITSLTSCAKEEHTEKLIRMNNCILLFISAFIIERKKSL